MQIKPLVSIIIPTHNRSQFLGVTLDSVLAQTYQNWECLVIDDGSTDDTEALVKAYMGKDARFQYHKRPDSYLPGGNGARNFGFELSSGEYIQWFDDDDVMLPDFLNEKVLALKKGIDLVICSGSYTDMCLKNHKTIDITIEKSLFKEYLMWQAEVLTPSVLFRKSFLDDKLLFSDKIYRGQETELLSRFFYRLEADQFVVLNTPLFLYRQHDLSKTSLNEAYVSKFKYSQSIIFIDNLERAILIEDIELINYCFQTLLIHFFAALKHKDYKTARYIYKRLLPIFRRYYFNFYFEFKIFGYFMLFFKRNSYRIETRWKNKHLC